MRATELMFGDYIYDLYGNKAIVRKLDDYNEHAKASGVLIELVEGAEEGETFCLYGEIEPIPLTEEVLVKNGFRRDNCVGDRYHLGDGNGWFTICGNTIERQWWDTIHDYYDYMELETIQFVHELQHWLKVIGINKKIEL